MPGRAVLHDVLLAGHCHKLADVADLQHHIELPTILGVERDAALLVLLEVCLFDGQRVSARHERREDELTIFVRLHASLRACRVVCNNDGRAGDHRTGCISDLTIHSGRGLFLCEGRAAGCKNQCKCEEKSFQFEVTFHWAILFHGWENHDSTGGFLKLGNGNCRWIEEVVAHKRVRVFLHIGSHLRNQSILMV